MEPLRNPMRVLTTVLQPSYKGPPGQGYLSVLASALKADVAIELDPGSKMPQKELKTIYKSYLADEYSKTPGLKFIKPVKTIFSTKWGWKKVY